MPLSELSDKILESRVFQLVCAFCALGFHKLLVVKGILNIKQFLRTQKYHLPPIKYVYTFI